MGATIWTIGHSTHPIDHFIGLLHASDIQALVDVRRFPGSRRHPQFGRDELAASLTDEDIAYHWLGEALGGRRRETVEGSGNDAWRHPAFRAYADYTASDEYRAGIDALESIARVSQTAIMCSECRWWQCHRWLVSNTLQARGWEVLHIMREGPVAPHHLPDFAQLDGQNVRYPAAQGTLQGAGPGA